MGKLSGCELSRTAVSASDLLVDVHHRLLDGIALMRGVRVLLPSGELILAAVARNPSISFTAGMQPAVATKAHSLKRSTREEHIEPSSVEVGFRPLKKIRLNGKQPPVYQ